MKGDNSGAISLAGCETLRSGLGTVFSTAVRVPARLVAETGQVLAASLYVGGDGAYEYGATDWVGGCNHPESRSATRASGRKGAEGSKKEASGSQ